MPILPVRIPETISIIRRPNERSLGDPKKVRSSSSHISTIAHSNKGEAGVLSEEERKKERKLVTRP